MLTAMMVVAKVRSTAEAGSQETDVGSPVWRGAAVTSCHTISCLQPMCAMVPTLVFHGYSHPDT